MKTFKTVHVENNWEMLFTSIGETRLSCKEEYFVDVKWPDGTVENNLPVKWQYRERSVSDHGHIYTYTSYVAMIETEYRGMKFDVPLEKFKARISSSKKTTKKSSKR